jgi:cell division protein FtsI (penicillin-binding protein 3)
MMSQGPTGGARRRTSAPRRGSPTQRRIRAAQRQARAAERQTHAAERRARAAERHTQAIRRRQQAPQRRAAAARRWRAPLGSLPRRFSVALITLAVLASLLGTRALQIQGLDPASNARQALSETTRKATVPATRGTITDRNGELLVVSEPAVNVVGDPNTVVTNGLELADVGPRARLRALAAPGLVAGLLTEYLGGNFESYYNQLTQTTTTDGTPIRYTILARQVREYTYVLLNQALTKLRYVGIDDERAPVRTYPNGNLAANLLGYMVYDEALDAAGQYPWSGGGGLELTLDAELSGIDGQEIYEASSHGRIPTGPMIVEEPRDGISYQLTIDAGLQYEVETRLRKAVEDHQSRSGTALVLSIKTGELLAMATYPTFDPNAISEARDEDLGNRVIGEVYEPGSVEKVLTFAALLDAGLVTPDTQVEVPGCVVSGGRPICDSGGGHATWQLTATGVMALSSNVGSLLLTRQMDHARFSDYLKSFGLGSPTALGLPGEQAGEPPPPEMSDQTRDQVAFGQGLSMTAVQMASAVAGVVNEGVYVSPTVIKSATTSDGVAYGIPQQTTRQVISAEASDQLLAMMESVVTTNNYGIEGYRVAGKTGTSERYNETCACYRGYIGSYIAVAPVEDPQILVYVVIDDPQKGEYGSQVAAPSATDIMKVALPRYGVPTSTTTPPTYQIRW